MSTKYVLRRVGDIRAIGDNEVHYLGSAFGSGEDGLEDATLWKSLKGLKSSNAVKYDKYEIVPVSVTVKLEG